MRVGSPRKVSECLLGHLPVISSTRTNTNTRVAYHSGWEACIDPAVGLKGRYKQLDIDFWGLHFVCLFMGLQETGGACISA